MKTIMIVLVLSGTFLLYPGKYQGYKGFYSIPPDDSITDTDGNIYHTIRIVTANSEQVWMVENLKVTNFCNGDPISNVKDLKAWSILTTAAYCDYENKPDKQNVYGKLYNWFAVTDERNICPTGWHIPSTDEWFTLTSYLGENDAGNKLKETGTTNWHSPNTGATNETGFKALPAGYRYEDASFGEKSYCSYFWSSTELNPTNAWTRKMINHESSIKTCVEDKRCGFSVRCIKD